MSFINAGSSPVSLTKLITFIKILKISGNIAESNGEVPHGKRYLERRETLDAG